MAERRTGDEDARAVRERLYEILERVDRLPMNDTRSDDEILGYDEHGLPGQRRSAA
jgi:hypothetical protein